MKPITFMKEGLCPFRSRGRLPVLFLCLMSFTFIRLKAQSPAIEGELRKWHKITFTFDGPNTSETSTPNPFSDYSLNVTFSNGARSYTVPGYFAACGNAAETSCTSGNKWRVHFAPDEEGTWSYTTSFRQGNEVAINGGGSSVSGIDGTSGSFNVGPSDKTGLDNRAKGRLLYVGEHYLKIPETDEWFFKVGADAPENTLAYEDFDDVPNKSGRRKSWAPHQQDYDPSDASEFTWQSGKGTEILGMVKYLSDQGMNVFSFLTFSLSGDDKNVFPHLLKVSVSEYNGLNNNDQWNVGVYKDRFDISRMDQWERLFEYADKKGIYLHFKTQETENDQRMDGGNVGRERKLYYRELVARYSHHLALNWNTGEENSQTAAQEVAMAEYLESIDPYNHNRVMHTYPGQKDRYNSLTGNQSEYTGASLQSGIGQVHSDTRIWVQNSRNAGKKWVVANDEQGSAQSGVNVDADYPDAQLPENRGQNDNREAVRRQVLWGNMLAGGAGVEYYYGYQTGCDDLDCQDHRTRESKWADARVAKDFFNTYLQSFVTSMVSNDGLTSDNQDYVFQKEEDVYVIYRPSGGSVALNLPTGNVNYQLQWFDPISGSIQNPIAFGPSLVAPDNSQDWVALIQNTSAVNDSVNLAPSVAILQPANNSEFETGTDVIIQATASDNDGSVAFVTFFNAQNQLSVDSVAPYSFTFENISAGNFSIRVVATDNEGATGEASVSFLVDEPVVAFAIPGVIEAEDANTLSGSVRVEDTPGTTGQNLGFIRNGDFADYEIRVDVPGTYRVDFSVSSRGSGGNIDLLIDDSEIGSVTVPVNGQWHEYSVQSTSIALDSGNHTLKLSFAGPSGFLYNIDNFTFTEEAGEIFVTDLNFINCPTDSLVVGEMIDLDVEILPLNATNQTLAFTTSTGTGVDFLSGEFTAQVAGEITVTVTSFSDGSVSDQCIITVVDSVPPNQPPVANAGIDQFVVDDDLNGNELATLDGSASFDPDGAIVSFRWILDGSEIATGINPTVNLFSGVNIITLEVTDDQGSISTDQVEITVDEIRVTDLNFINCPDTLVLGEMIDLDVEILPANASNQTLAFTTNSGSGVDFLSGEFTAETVGDVLVMVTSFSDGSVSDECYFTVVDSVQPNLSPVANAGPDQFIVDEDRNGNELVTLDGSASFDPDGTIVSFRWILNDSEIATGAIPTLSLNSGVNIITLEVTDNDGGVATDIVEITVDEIRVTDLNFINCPSEPLFIGDMIDLDVEILPANATNQTLAFTTSTGTGVDFLDGEFTAEFAGDITVFVTSFSNGSVSDECSITVLDPSDTIPSSETSFFLVDADADVTIRALVESDVIDKSANPSNLSIIYDPGQTVASVRFELSGASSRIQTENVFPYSLSGDINGDYRPLNLPSGDYLLIISAHDAPGAGGNLLLRDTIEFTVTENTSSSTRVSSPGDDLTTQLQSLAEIILYPNPARDFLNLANLTIEDVQQVLIFNELGVLVRSEELISDIPKIDIRSLESGLYFIRLQGSKNTLRFFKE